MNDNLQNFLKDTLKSTFKFIKPYLSNYSNFTSKLSNVVNKKDDFNVQYDFDLEIDKLIKQKLKTFKIEGQIFSEESDFFTIGREKKYRVIYDPFCNSSLTTRGFHEAAVGISIFKNNFEFITSAILDLQTGIVGHARKDNAIFYQIQTHKTIKPKHKQVKNLDKAWVVASLEKVSERKNIDKIEKLFKQSKRLILSSGHIYWLKLALGQIDAYLDPFRGEPLYEMFASTVALKNGCSVTDIEGNNFDPSEELIRFFNSPKQRYYPVAARNVCVHNKLLSNLQL